MATDMLAQDVEAKLHVAGVGGDGVGVGTNADYMDLYSRQIGAYGMELMGKLVRLRVLIVGMGGVGVETAKNLVLAGPQSVTIFDSRTVTLADLGTNFYLRKRHVGKTTRANASVEQLRTLNPYVNVEVFAGDLTDDIIKTFHVVAFTDTRSSDELNRVNKVCRQANPSIAFIATETNGVSAFVFCDFGPAHAISDPDGEPTHMNVVEYISDTGEVTVADDRHKLDDGDHVRFDEVEGMTALNTLDDPIEVKRIFRTSTDKAGMKREVLVPNRFQLLDIDCSKFGTYTCGGLVSQVKKAKTIAFRSFSDSCRNPVMPEQYMGLPHMDMNKLLCHQRASHLHFARLALWRFLKSNKNKLPALHSSADAEKCVQFAKSILEEHKKAIADGEEALVVDEIDEAVIRNVALYAKCELPGFTAFLGGVIAQEIVKAPGKYTPLTQWFHHDAFELLSNNGPPSPADPNTPSRYDHQLNVFGKEFQEKMLSQKWFLVGAGALGCEYFKGMALMGLGCGPKGMIYCTDMDRIEVSNLSRQFLFRRDHVGQPKSSCAAAAARDMNPDLNVKTFEVPVGPTTEEVFHSTFWDSLDGVWNALDNVEARRYTDSKCVLHEKPLLESGTLGTKANSEVILPFKTQTYSDQKEQEEDSIPMCTLRNFPHFIEHCIEWARAQFNNMFEDSPQEVNTFIRDRAAFFEKLKTEGSASAQLETLRIVDEWIDMIVNGRNMKTAIQLALEAFHKQFRNRINDLIHHFPKDSRKRDKDTGADLGEFWSGQKRFPQAAQFDPSDPLHQSFIYNCANLFALTFGLEPVRDMTRIIALAAEVKTDEWVAPAKMNVKLDDDDKDSHDDDVDQVELEKTKRKLRSIDVKSLKSLLVADFEKDDDTNFHVDFITSCANLRAWNYRIKQTTRHKCKMIAGKIIPALATTTAMITGLVEIELYKLLLNLKVDDFANTNVNLAVHSFQSFAPLEPKKAKADFDVVMCEEIKPIPDGFTVWDKVVIKRGNLTTNQFIDALAKQHFGVKVELLFKKGITDEMIASGKGKALYNGNQFLSDTVKKANAVNLTRNLKELYEECYGHLAKSSTFVLLEATVTDQNGGCCIIPPIKYYW